MLQTLATAISASGKSDRPQQIYFDKVTFLHADGNAIPAATWKQLDILVEEQGKRLTASFQAADHGAADDGDTPQKVTLERTADADGTNWFLDARGNRLDAEWLQAWSPVFSELNPDAVFENALATLHETNGRWSGEVRGRIINLDLAHVINRQFGTAISGMATATITSAVISDNQLLEIEGHVYSPTGRIGSALLNACQQCLGMQIVEPYGGQDESYRDLRFGFLINNHSLAVFAHQAGGIVNSASGQTMLVPRHGQPHPVDRMFALLVWPNPHVLPTSRTRNVASLAQRISLPEATDVRTAEEPPDDQGSFNR